MDFFHDEPTLYVLVENPGTKRERDLHYALKGSKPKNISVFQDNALLLV